MGMISGVKQSSIPRYLERFLEEPWEAVLSTIGPSGRPQQTVMWFGRSQDRLFLTCLEKRIKVRNLKANPLASLLLVGPGCYASFQGKVSIDNDPRIAQENLEQLMSRYVAPEQVPDMIERMTHPYRVSLWFEISSSHSHRVRQWTSALSQKH